MTEVIFLYLTDDFRVLSSNGCYMLSR